MKYVVQSRKDFFQQGLIVEEFPEKVFENISLKIPFEKILQNL